MTNAQLKQRAKQEFEYRYSRGHIDSIEACNWYAREQDDLSEQDQTIVAGFMRELATQHGIGD